MAELESTESYHSSKSWVDESEEFDTSGDVEMGGSGCSTPRSGPATPKNLLPLFEEESDDDDEVSHQVALETPCVVTLGSLGKRVFGCKEKWAFGLVKEVVSEVRSGYTMYPVYTVGRIDRAIVEKDDRIVITAEAALKGCCFEENLGSCATEKEAVLMVQKQLCTNRSKTWQNALIHRGELLDYSCDQNTLALVIRMNSSLKGRNVMKSRDELLKRRKFDRVSAKTFVKLVRNTFGDDFPGLTIFGRGENQGCLDSLELTHDEGVTMFGRPMMMRFDPTSETICKAVELRFEWKPASMNLNLMYSIIQYDIGEKRVISKAKP